MNKHLFVTDAKHFSIDYEINPYMHTGDQPDRAKAIQEHEAFMQAHRDAGRTLEYLPSVAGIPDMVYTANSGLTRGNKVILSNLPPERQPETPHYRKWYEEHGFEVIEAPYLFSGQGDALPCGDLVIAGTSWRTDQRMHQFIADNLGYTVIPVQTLSAEWYDIDLSVAILRPNLIAYCADAMEPESAERLASLPNIKHIIVSIEEARNFACNLVSDGTTVTMTNRAPELAAAIRARGLKVVELATNELAKGGGGIRCTSLSLDN